MTRSVTFGGIAALMALTAAGVSGAASDAGRATRADRVCASLIQSRNAAAYPPTPNWVWAIPTGCVFTRSAPPTPGCPGQPSERDSCIPPSDVVVRSRGRQFVFHLTLRNLPPEAKGVWRAGGQRRFFVSLDGRGKKERQGLWILFTGREFDGVIQSGPSKGMSDLGPRRWWEIGLTLDRRSGVLRPREGFDVDPTIG